MGLVGAIGGSVPSIHPDAWVAPSAVVVGRVRLGRAASVWYGAVLRADDAEIVVGAACNIQDQCCLHVDPGEPVILEERVSLGHRASVHGAYVATGALIGIGAIVLGGAVVGAGSLVAAGAVVTPGMRIPAGVLVTGVPARIHRELTAADRASFAETAERYVSRARQHRDAIWRQATQQPPGPPGARSPGGTLPGDGVPRAGLPGAGLPGGGVPVAGRAGVVLPGDGRAGTGLAGGGPGLVSA
jgi:carbonic anhydrase/acetyltransferase-like protein (isoleucine patch superfamily)